MYRYLNISILNVLIILFFPIHIDGAKNYAKMQLEIFPNRYFLFQV